MGMRIQGSNAAAASQQTSAANWQQRKQGFNDLVSALQAGDQGGAQKAYDALTAGQVPSKGPLASIGQSLQGGDLAGALQAAQASQTGRADHHRHSHGARTSGSPGTGSVLDVSA